MNLFNEFDRFFNQEFSIFNRPVKDMQPYNIYKEDNGFIIVINTLGIGKDDLNIEIVRERGKAYPILKISGETNMERIAFQNNIKLGISLNIDEKIDELAYEVKNGLTIIYLKFEETEEERIMAKYIDDPDSFNF